MSSDDADELADRSPLDYLRGSRSSSASEASLDGILDEFPLPDNIKAPPTPIYPEDLNPRNARGRADNSGIEPQPPICSRPCSRSVSRTDDAASSSEKSPDHDPEYRSVARERRYRRYGHKYSESSATNTGTGLTSRGKNSESLKSTSTPASPCSAPSPSVRSAPTQASSASPTSPAQLTWPESDAVGSNLGIGTFPEADLISSTSAVAPVSSGSPSAAPGASAGASAAVLPASVADSETCGAHNDASPNDASPNEAAAAPVVAPADLVDSADPVMFVDGRPTGPSPSPLIQRHARLPPALQIASSTPRCDRSDHVHQQASHRPASPQSQSHSQPSPHLSSAAASACTAGSGSSSSAAAAASSAYAAAHASGSHSHASRSPVTDDVCPAATGPSQANVFPVPWGAQNGHDPRFPCVGLSPSTVPDSRFAHVHDYALRADNAASPAFLSATSSSPRHATAWKTPVIGAGSSGPLSGAPSWTSAYPPSITAASLSASLSASPSAARSAARSAAQIASRNALLAAPIFPASTSRSITTSPVHIRPHHFRDDRACFQFPPADPATHAIGHSDAAVAPIAPCMHAWASPHSAPQPDAAGPAQAQTAQFGPREKPVSSAVDAQRAVDAQGIPAWRSPPASSSRSPPLSRSPDRPSSPQICSPSIAVFPRSHHKSPSASAQPYSKNWATTNRGSPPSGRDDFQFLEGAVPTHARSSSHGSIAGPSPGVRPIDFDMFAAPYIPTSPHRQSPFDAPGSSPRRSFEAEFGYKPVPVLVPSRIETVKEDLGMSAGNTPGPIIESLLDYNPTPRITDQIGHVGEITQVGHTGPITQGLVGQITQNQVSQVDQTTQGQVGHVVEITQGQVSYTGQITQGQIGQVGHIGHIGHIGQVDQVTQGQVSHVVEITQGEVGHTGQITQGQVGHVVEISEARKAGQGELGQTSELTQVVQIGEITQGQVGQVAQGQVDHVVEITQGQVGHTGQITQARKVSQSEVGYIGEIPQVGHTGEITQARKVSQGQSGHIGEIKQGQVRHVVEITQAGDVGQGEAGQVGQITQSQVGQFTQGQVGHVVEITPARKVSQGEAGQISEITQARKVSQGEVGHVGEITQVGQMDEISQVDKAGEFAQVGQTGEITQGQVHQTEQIIQGQADRCGDVTQSQACQVDQITQAGQMGEITQVDYVGQITQGGQMSEITKGQVGQVGQITQGQADQLTQGQVGHVVEITQARKVSQGEVGHASQITQGQGGHVVEITQARKVSQGQSGHIGETTQGQVVHVVEITQAGKVGQGEVGHVVDITQARKVSQGEVGQVGQVGQVDEVTQVDQFEEITQGEIVQIGDVTHLSEVGQVGQIVKIIQIDPTRDSTQADETVDMTQLSEFGEFAEIAQFAKIIQIDQTAEVFQANHINTSGSRNPFGPPRPPGIDEVLTPSSKSSSVGPTESTKSGSVEPTVKPASNNPFDFVSLTEGPDLTTGENPFGSPNPASLESLIEDLEIDAVTGDKTGKTGKTPSVPPIIESILTPGSKAGPVRDPNPFGSPRPANTESMAPVSRIGTPHRTGARPFDRIHSPTVQPTIESMSMQGPTMAPVDDQNPFGSPRPADIESMSTQEPVARAASPFKPSHRSQGSKSGSEVSMVPAAGYTASRSPYGSPYRPPQASPRNRSPSQRPVMSRKHSFSRSWDAGDRPVSPQFAPWPLAPSNGSLTGDQHVRQGAYMWMSGDPYLAHQHWFIAASHPHNSRTAMLSLVMGYHEQWFPPDISVFPNFGPSFDPTMIQNTCALVSKRSPSPAELENLTATMFSRVATAISNYATKLMARQSDSEALEFSELAGNLGSADAWTTAAKIYYKGSRRVPKDLVKAKRLYERADKSTS